MFLQKFGDENMNQRWTLHVENFARVESADIEISPLLCFIGDNNSGNRRAINYCSLYASI